MAAQVPTVLPATAEMPMAGGQYQARLWTAAQKTDSLYELLFEHSEIGKLLARDSTLKRYNFRISSTAACLSRALGSQWEVALLLHSMDVDMIRATILGTMAHEEFCGNLRGSYPNPSSEDNAQGVYVVGLRRVGMRGKFLDREETERLIVGLEDYLEGSQALSGAPGARSQRQQSTADWVRKVDGSLRGSGQSGSASSYFVTSGPDAANVKALIRSFKRRVVPPPLTGPDTDKDVRQVQSPLYVGCSTNLRSRLADYNPSRHLRKVNKNLGLVASILHALDLPVDLAVRVAVRTWKPSQLRLAEQLVTTLASSLVYQCGFNAIEAGGNAGSLSGVNDATELVQGRYAHLHNNIQSTVAEFQRRKAFERELDKLADGVASLEVEARQAREDFSSFQTQVEKDTLQELLERGEDAAALVRQLIIEYRTVRQMCEILLAVNKFLYPEAAAIVEAKAVDDKSTDLD